MCSVQEEGVASLETRPTISQDQKCMKCVEPARVVIRGSDPMCKACFMAYCTHKFRAAFGKSRIVRDGESTLVAFSGGINSSAMLHLIKEGKSPRANRKLRFQPSLVFIDEGAVLDVSESEREESRRKVVDQMIKSELPWCIYSLEEALSVHVSEGESETRENLPEMADLEGQLENIHLYSHNSEKLKALLAAAKTQTAKECLVESLRNRLLVHVARSRGFSKVLMGDSSTRLAIKMLSNITQGRGAHVALEMSFADCRFDDVTLVRPMREFVAKEVALYIGLNGIQTVVLPTLTTMTSPYASLERLTEEFVSGLQAVHPRTVPTIFRTGEKMDITNLDDTSNTDRCVFCQAPLDTDVGVNSALGATIFSQTLSAKKKSQCGAQARDENGCCGEGDGSCQSKSTSLKQEDLQGTLCYGCQLVIKDMGGPSTLPEFLVKDAEKTVRRKQMKEAIQDFLLDDEGDQKT